MLFKIDENLPAEVAVLLTEAGHEAMTVLGQAMGGTAGPSLIERCREEGRALVTLDLDFADIRTYPPRDYPGIIVIRAPRTDAPTVLELAAQIPAFLDREPLDRRLWIVEFGRVRLHE